MVTGPCKIGVREAAMLAGSLLCISYSLTALSRPARSADVAELASEQGWESAAHLRRFHFRKGRA